MNCFTHTNRPAAGICAVCQKAICHDCVGRDAPRLVCGDCLSRGSMMYGWEYKSTAAIGGMAVGSIAVGGLAVGFKYAIGGGAFGPSVIDGRHCDEAARDLWSRWFGARSLPPPCTQNPFRLIR